jgi:hypothetical protein
MDLVEFLTARLAEDEHRAQYALSRGPIAADDPMFGGMWYGLWAHTTRHLPARVLREVGAMRAIIEAADEASMLDSSVDLDRRVGPRDMDTEPLVGDVILRALAAVYADHDDYNPEWAIA